jgi:hypothetical protein
VTGLFAGVASPDPRVRVVLATRLVTLAAAPVTLLLVMTRLVPAEQGLYFIFLNAFALAQLFETGVGSLVVQYASHELQHVEWGPAGAIVASEPVMRRVRAMLRRAVRWYVGAAIVMTTAAVPLGLALFADRAQAVSTPTTSLWIITILATAAYLLLVPVLNTIEGSGRLVEVQQMRLMQAILVAVSAWALIPSVGGLVAVATTALLQFAVAITWLLRRYRALMVLAWGAATHDDDGVITPELDRLHSTQSRTAAVWLSAHIAAQGLTPLVLYYHGAAGAGQVGVTLAITTVPYTIGMSWLQGRFPDFGGLAATGRHRELDAAARDATLHAVAVCVVGAVSVIGGIEVLGRFAPQLRDRILPLWPAAALAAAASVGLLIQAMAGYIRAYRGEPLVRVLVGGYATMLAAAWLVASRRGSSEAAIAYAVASVAVALPAVALTLRHERSKLGLTAKGSSRSG